jgi:hypothetical protein
MRIILSLLLCLHLLLPMAVWAQESAKAKNPLDYSLSQYGLMLGVALLGGIVGWWGKVRKGELPAWSIHHLIGELVTSAFAGLLCFWLCELSSAPPLLTAALTGISGHMGARALTMFEEWGKAKFPGVGKRID